ncbi:hypothetical protein PBRA_000298 [Plasmodiophora brassicae]|uniref:Uncharacterized protein n=1 Tax=Plasmodiophora brassicae TaxID=37360 RepID=A0A0G4IH34_PLABS|nr:hypothetical protein PBRA_000298 [Plasmodiophora brassicae]
MLTPDDDGGAAGNDRGRRCRRRPWGLSVTIPTPNADDYAKVDHDGNIWVAPGRFSLRPSSWINGPITAPILPNPAAASRYLGGMLTPQPRRWRPGQAVALAMEPQSSRMLQKCLEEGGIQEFDLMFQEVLAGFPTLAGHAFGNYLCQKLIDKSPPEHRALILRRLAGSIARLSVDVHGTRVIQNLIELCTTPEETALITLEFKGLAVNARSQAYDWVFDELSDECGKLATDQVGCRVFQTAFDVSTGTVRERLALAITENAAQLSVDQWGNYVVQRLLHVGDKVMRRRLIQVLLPSMATLALLKFSSNVVERCLRRAPDEALVDAIVAEMCMSGPERLAALMCDPYGNYCVQTAMRVYESSQAKLEHLAGLVRPHLPLLKVRYRQPVVKNLAASYPDLIYERRPGDLFPRNKL